MALVGVKMTDTLSIHDLLSILAKLELENAQLKTQLDVAENVVEAADSLAKASLFARSNARSRLKEWVLIYRGLKRKEP